MAEKLTVQDVLDQGKRFGREHMKVIEHLPWKSSTPDGVSLIVAKIKEDFPYAPYPYLILSWVYGWGQEQVDGYYDDQGNQIPVSAIEEWFELK